MHIRKSTCMLIVRLQIHIMPHMLPGCLHPKGPITQHDTTCIARVACHVSFEAVVVHGGWHLNHPCVLRACLWACWGCLGHGWVGPWGAGGQLLGQPTPLTLRVEMPGWDYNDPVNAWPQTWWVELMHLWWPAALDPWGAGHTDAAPGHMKAHAGPKQENDQNC
jgi:hypothetical protein